MSEPKSVSWSPIKAIRKKCLDCSGESHNEVSLCPVTGCPLYPYRFGKNPNRKGRKMTPEQREAATERLAKARQAQGGA
jgi:hypothetical protein